MPERDIKSLGVMGWGLETARKFFRRRRRRRPAQAPWPWALGPLGPGPMVPWAHGPKFHKIISPR